MAGVTLGDIDVHSAWQACHLRRWADSGGALGSQWAAVCVAGVALGDMDLHLAWQAWQAWHLVTSTCILRDRHGTYGTGLALVARLVPSRRRCRCAVCVAGVALGDIDLLGDMDLHLAW